MNGEGVLEQGHLGVKGQGVILTPPVCAWGPGCANAKLCVCLGALQGRHTGACQCGDVPYLGQEWAHSCAHV